MRSHSGGPAPGQVPGISIEEEVRRGRKFSAEEAMARLAGPGAMSGASPVSAVQQAEIEIANWLRAHLTGASELREVICRRLHGSELLLSNVEQPLFALTEFSRRVLASEFRLEELVREADVEWGRQMDEPPRFDRKGSSGQLGDPYTLRSVRELLESISTHLPSAAGPRAG